jgi:predicted protein tyrosine phosphatase
MLSRFFEDLFYFSAFLRFAERRVVCLDVPKAASELLTLCRSGIAQYLRRIIRRHIKM